MAKNQGEEVEELDQDAIATEDEGQDQADDAGDQSDDGAEEEDTTWMQDEETDSSEDDDDEQADGTGPKGVPVDKHILMKQKLKKKLLGKDDENVKLKERIKELEEGGAQKKVALDLSKPVRPRRNTFKSDDDYEDAMDEHEEKLAQFIPKVAATEANTAEQLQRRVKVVTDAVDGHIDRAAKLIEKHSIDPDVYSSAQDSVKQIIGSVKPGGEDHIFNEFIERLGEGSEKVMFYVGKNKKQLNEFERLFRSDPSGLSAAMFLAEKRNEIAGAKNLSSRSPKPSAKLRGGEAVKASESALKKKYDEAHKKGNNQEAFNIKRQAKGAKIDTSGW